MKLYVGDIVETPNKEIGVVLEINSEGDMSYIAWMNDEFKLYNHEDLNVSESKRPLSEDGRFIKLIELLQIKLHSFPELSKYILTLADEIYNNKE